MSRVHNCEIIHAANGGEVHADKYKFDGYAKEGSQTYAYEFLGCL